MRTRSMYEVVEGAVGIIVGLGLGMAFGAIFVILVTGAMR